VVELGDIILSKHRKFLVNFDIFLALENKDPSFLGELFAELNDLDKGLFQDAIQDAQEQLKDRITRIDSYKN
jgi:hypothetical protein